MDDTREEQTDRAPGIEAPDTETRDAQEDAEAQTVDVRAHQDEAPRYAPRYIERVAATAPDPATVPQPPDDNLLSMEEILKGGDDPYTRLEVPELSKNGVPGVVYIRQPPAKQVIAFSEMEAGSLERQQEQYRLVGAAMVTKDGNPIFPKGEQQRAGEIPTGAFIALLKAVTAGMAGEVGDDVKNG